MSSRTKLALLVSGAFVCAVLAACSSSDTVPLGVGQPTLPTTGDCRTPTEGCVCNGAQTVECGQKVNTERGGQVCAAGRRSCVNGRWGACDTSALSTKGLDRLFTSVSPMALGNSTSCGDACNPLCSTYNDNPTGLDAGVGFSVTDGGVTLAAATTCQTRINGQIFDPADALPLPNVYVFLQEGTMSALPEGVAQDSCSTILTGGAGGGLPGVRVQSGLDGSFSLQLPNGYPNGTPFNMVVQTGRWRKVVPLTASCTTQNLGHVRLPRNRTEGNIPQMAVVTGDADTLECFVAKIGVDTAEFTHPSGLGRVHVYQGCLGNNVGTCGPQLQSGAPYGGPVPEKRTSLLASQAELDRHAMLVLPCEGGKKSDNSANYPNNAEVDRVKTFADNGGRIFATHLSDLYLYHEADGTGAVRNMYPGTAVYKTGGDNMFNNSGSGVGAQEATVNTAAPRAQRFYDWLVANGGLNGFGRVYFAEGRRRALAASPPNGQTWLSNYNFLGFPFYDYVHHITFDTPVGSPNPEGRIVYLSSHVAPVNHRRSGTGTFPGECNLGNALTASEKALEYMFFDVSACVGASPPAPPPLYSTATFSRDFIAQCATGTRVRWRQYQADVDTPGDSRIQFRAQTADSVAAVAGAPIADVHLAQGLTPDTPVGGILIDSDQAGGVIPIRASRSVLRITAEFVPTSDGQATPSLYSWSQRYDCEQAE